MALRGRLSDSDATFPDPVFGVNLNTSPENVQRGEAALMQNCVNAPILQKRLGSSLLTPSQLAANWRVAGGNKFYKADGTGIRLIAYGTKIVVVNDAGAESSVLTSVMASDKDTYFATWSIQDKVYVANGVNELHEYDGTIFRAVSLVPGAIAVPGNGGNPAAVQVLPILDRLFAVTTAGVIERTNARLGHVWSVNSSWATLRPSLSGPVVAMIPHSLSGDGDTVVGGALVLQNNAYYWMTGTDYGVDVTSPTPSTDHNASIALVDGGVGGIGPRSTAVVPGVGAFWVTSDLDIYHVPLGRSVGIRVGERIRSNRSDVRGINNANIAQGKRIALSYFGRFLRVAFPVDANTYPSVQYWLDVDAFKKDPRVPVWYGPMVGPTYGTMWRENQGAENRLLAGEGDSATGVFVYLLDVDEVYVDAIGTATANVEMEYHTYAKTFGAPSREKNVVELEFELNNFAGSAFVDLADLSAVRLSDIPIQKVRV